MKVKSYLLIKDMIWDDSCYLLRIDIKGNENLKYLLISVEKKIKLNIEHDFPPHPSKASQLGKEIDN